MILEEVGKPARLGEHATPLEEAIGDTVRWYRSKLPAGGIRPAA
jgi:hypothetical protein